MKTILIHPDVKGAEEFLNIMSNSLPNYHITTSLDETNSSDIEVLIFWIIVPAYLSSLPNLKLILSCGSGIDHFINSINIPNHITLIRLVDPYLRNRVANYVLLQILENHFPSLSHLNLAVEKLQIIETVQKSKLRVGVLGLGLIGSAVAKNLLDYGFEVSGWVRTKKNRTIKDVYVGEKELNIFAQKVNILVCQLPLTVETKGILNMDLFNQLPNGSFLINTGRGEHLEESDLILGIERGKLSGACLDVLQIKPLPTNHPFRSIPSIKLTPHIAGYVGYDTQAPYACNIIKSFFHEVEVEGIVNHKANY